MLIPRGHTGLEVALVALLSLLALAQRVTGNRVQGLPFLYPMTHTAAAGLVCLSVALWAAARGSRRLAQISAALASLIGISALGAQAIRWMQPFDSGVAHSAPMAVNFVHIALPNALFLVGLGAAIYVLAAPGPPAYLLALIGGAGGVVSALALCGLLNELVQIIPASPAFEGEMAVDASTSFALAGFALWRIARSRMLELSEGPRLRRPIVIAVLGAILAFLVWRALLHERTDIITEQTANAAAAAVRAIRSRVQDDPSTARGQLPTESALLAIVAQAAADTVEGSYQLFFVRDGKVIYTFPRPPGQYESSTVAEVPIPEFNAGVRLHPGSQFVRRGASWASHLVLAFGMTSSLLLAYSLYLVEISRQRVGQVEEEVIERRRAEQHMYEQAKLLTASNEDLEEFARVVSHDLQEPLRSLSGFAELLDRRYRGRLDSDADEFLGYITEAAQRMSNLINGMLSYSRSVYGRETTDRVDLNESLEWARHNLALSIEESKASIEAARLPTVCGNALQLAQVFQNLLSNAIKYRRPQAKPLIEIRCSHHDNEHVITVSDNGTGIPANLQDRVFGLFKRAHGREYAGTGVGLAVCKRIIEKHGGRIWVESTPGVGSRFCFTLPDVR